MRGRLGYKLDLIPSTPDARDRQPRVSFLRRLPPNADLPATPPVDDQGAEGSCTGFALTTAREAGEMGGGAPLVELSPAFLYYMERALEGTTTQDGGAMIRDGVRVLHKVGVCPESAMPYRAGDYRTPPSAAALAAATAHKIAAYTRRTSLRAIQGAIVDGHPVVIGIAVYDSFEAVGPDGFIPMPDVNREELLGGHAICVVGYRAQRAVAGGGYLILQNSWSTAFADRGYCYLPYAYATDRHFTFEAWSITQ